MKKKLYLFTMIFCVCFIAVVICLLFKNNNSSKAVDEDKLVYTDSNIAEKFSNSNYEAKIIYYKKIKENTKSDYSILRFSYKNDIEMFNDYQNKAYEFDDFTSKKMYLKTGNKDDNEAYSIKEISYDSYHSMIYDVLKNSKYYGENTYLLKTPSDVIKKFIESFNKRAESSIEYKEGKKYKVYVGLKDEDIESFTLLTEEENRISFTFSRVNKVNDISLP